MTAQHPGPPTLPAGTPAPAARERCGGAASVCTRPAPPLPCPLTPRPESWPRPAARHGGTGGPGPLLRPGL